MAYLPTLTNKHNFITDLESTKHDVTASQTGWAVHIPFSSHPNSCVHTPVVTLSPMHTHTPPLRQTPATWPLSELQAGTPAAQMALEKTHLRGSPWKALEPAPSQEHREIQDPENLEKGLEATAQPTGRGQGTLLPRCTDGID